MSLRRVTVMGQECVESFWIEQQKDGRWVCANDLFNVMAPLELPVGHPEAHRNGSLALVTQGAYVRVAFASRAGAYDRIEAITGHQRDKS